MNNKQKKHSNKFHLAVQVKYRTLRTPSGKEYNRSKQKRNAKKEIGGQ